MKTNSYITNNTLKKVLLSAALIFGAVTFSQATSTESQNLEDFKIEILDFKELPSIILVDKNLRIVAEFYGDSADVLNQFETTFQNAEMLSKHNNQSIYLALSH